MKSLPEQVAALKQGAGDAASGTAALIAALADPSKGIREEVINLLAAGGPPVVEALEEAVQSDNRRTAEGAVETASRMGRKAQSVLLKALSCEEGALRLKVLTAPPLQLLPEGSAALVACLDQPNRSVGRAAAEILAAARELDDRTPVIEELWSYLERRCLAGEGAAGSSYAGDTGWYLAAEILGSLLDRQSVPQRFKPFLESGTSSLTAVGARALGGSGGPEAAKSLIRLLRNPSPEVRGAAMAALNHIGRDALPLLKAVFSKSSAELRERVLAVMFGIMQSGSGPLLKRLLSAGTDLKLTALAALKETPGAWRIPHLVPCLTDTASQVAGEAAARIAETGPAGVPLLLTTLENEHIEDSEAVCRVLLDMGEVGRTAVADLLPKVDDPVRKHLISLIEAPLDEQFISALVALLPVSGTVVREAIAQTLGKSGPAVVEPLTQMILSGPAEAWYWASRALIDTGDGWQTWLFKALKDEELEPDKRLEAVTVLGRLSTALSARELLSAAAKLRPADIDLAVQEIKRCAPAAFYLSIIDDLEALKATTSEFLLKGLLSAAFPLIGDRVLDLLADEDDPQTLQFLLGSLGGDRLAEALPLILSLLDHQEQSVRYAAISALSGEDVPGKKGPLLSRVKVTGGEERLRLLEALADCHEEDVFSVIFSTYMAGDDKARETIVSLLRANPSVTMVKSVVKRLAIEGGDRSTTLQNLLAATLVTQEQNDAFKSIVQDRNPKIRAAAYGILGKIATTEAYTVLVDACRSERDSAIHLQLFTMLIREMMGGKSECRRLMEPYLKELGPEAAIPLVQVLAGLASGDFLHMAVSQMIENLGENALDVLDMLREDEDRCIASISSELADTIRRSMLVGT